MQSSFSIKKAAAYFFYIAGIFLLIYLIRQMGLETIWESMEVIGYHIFTVFAIATIWIMVNTWSVSFLLDHRVNFLKLLYVEITGTAYNNIIPMAGLGGEPYKLSVIADDVGVEKGARALLQNRLIVLISSLLFTALITGLTLLMVDVPTEMVWALWVAAAVSFAVGILIAFATLSKAPSVITGFLLTKLKVLKDYKNEPLPLQTFFIVNALQILGRALSMLEIYAIFYLLGFSPSIADLVCVSAFLSLSSSFFFFVPQGMGVNEAGISTAFTVLGYDPSLGLFFGLIRRARVIAWSLLGVGMHLAYGILNNPSRRFLRKRR